MRRNKIKDILNEQPIGQKVNVKGWVRTFRNNQFIALNDGSIISTLQVVVNREETDESLLKKITTGAAISATGSVVESQGKGQSVEVHADQIEVLGEADPEKYPL